MSLQEIGSDRHLRTLSHFVESASEQRAVGGGCQSGQTPIATESDEMEVISVVVAASGREAQDSIPTS